MTTVGVEYTHVDRPSPPPPPLPSSDRAVAFVGVPVDSANVVGTPRVLQSAAEIAPSGGTRALEADSKAEVYRERGVCQRRTRACGSVVH